MFSLQADEPVQDDVFSAPREQPADDDVFSLQVEEPGQDDVFGPRADEPEDEDVFGPPSDVPAEPAPKTRRPPARACAPLRVLHRRAAASAATAFAGRRPGPRG